MGKVDPVSDRLVWIDCEMTGLDLRRDALIELAGELGEQLPQGAIGGLGLHPQVGIEGGVGHHTFPA